jgi:hypothetical protein
MKLQTLVFHMFICTINNTTAALVYFAISLMSTQLSSDPWIGYFSQGFIEIPAGIMGPLLLLKYVQ